MCGLVGVFGAPNPNMSKVIEDLLQLDVVRGPHSTGIGVIGPKWYRPIVEVGVPWHLLNSKAYTKHVIKKSHENMGYIGHNRFATKGKVNTDNAHPFLHAPIMLTHNGTLPSSYSIELNKLHFDTDSETIAWHIREAGVESLWGKLQGAAALAWYNGKEDSLNLLRNDKRPLSYAYTAGKKQVIYSSEPGILRAVCWRRSVKLEKDKIYNAVPDQHICFTRDEKGNINTQLRALKPYVIPPYAPSKWQLEREARLKKEKENRSNINKSMANFTGGSGGKVVGLPVPYTLPALPHLQKENKGVDAKLFHSVYTECHSCGGTLDFETAMMIDASHAACDECCSTAELFGMRIEGVMM